jgi:hypothetical protein
MHQITSTGQVIVSDRFSSRRGEPREDQSQDLLSPTGYANASHWVVQYTRLLNTGDPKDIVFSAFPGTMYRYMFCVGRKYGEDDLARSRSGDAKFGYGCKFMFSNL